MRSLWIIAKNTYREIIRDRILYGIVVFALLLIGLSLVLGELSFAEQARISADFGFGGIQIGGSILAIFAGSTLVAREIEKQTILALLTRPLTRSQFLLGKYLGLSCVVGVVVVGLAMVLAAVMLWLGFSVHGNFFVALWGVLLEALLLMAVTLLFGVFTRPSLSVIFAATFFLLGHWVSSLDFFIEKSESPSFQLVARVIRVMIPDLERFNWRSAPIYGAEVYVGEILKASTYAAGWILVLLAIAALIFRRRDFV